MRQRDEAKATSAFELDITADGRICDARSPNGELARSLPLYGDGTIYPLFPEKNRQIVGKLIGQILSGAGSASYDVALVLPNAPRAVYRMAPAVREDGTIRLTFTRVSDEPGGGVLDGDSFINAMAARLIARPGDPVDLMLVEFGCLSNPEVHERLGAEVMKSVRAAIEHRLVKHSETGEIGRMGARGFGLVARRGASPDDLIDDVQAAAGPLGLDPAVMSGRGETVELDADGLEPGLIHRALGHLRDRFMGVVQSMFGISPTSLRAAADEAVAAERLIRAALVGQSLLLETHAVFDLRDEEPAFHLSRGLLDLQGTAVAADRLMRLSALPDLAIEHDLAVVTAAIDRLSNRHVDGAGRTYFVGIEIVSLLSARFREAVRLRVEAAELGAAQIGFRVPGLGFGPSLASAHAAMQAARSTGHPMWLTHFTAAVTASEALSALDGCYVEVATPYLADLCSRRDGFDLLERFLTLWTRAGVQVIATQVDGVERLALIRELGISYVVPVGTTMRAQAYG